MLTFIDIRDVWINADFRENSLERISPGDRADVVFDALPGRVFPAKVDSIGWDLARSGQTGTEGGLPTIRNQGGWLRDPHRFTVRLYSTGAVPPIGARYNSQANVIRPALPS